MRNGTSKISTACLPAGTESIPRNEFWAKSRNPAWDLRICPPGECSQGIGGPRHHRIPGIISQALADDPSHHRRGCGHLLYRRRSARHAILPRTTAVALNSTIPTRWRHQSCQGRSSTCSASRSSRTWLKPIWRAHVITAKRSSGMRWSATPAFSSWA